jgi:acetoin utilization deacetylase AcuC-like enzyme
MATECCSVTTTSRRSRTPPTPYWSTGGASAVTTAAPDTRGAALPSAAVRVVYSSDHVQHAPALEVMNGRPIGIFEVPARAEAIRAALAADVAFTFEHPTEHGVEPIETVHDSGLVAHLRTAWDRMAAAVEGAVELVPDTFLHPGLREGMGEAPVPAGAVAALGRFVFDTATPLVEGTYAAARGSVDVALSALDIVLGGEHCAYALCRPPGHHAARSVYGGYCYFNNAAIVASRARAAGAERVTILDVDYHHGNGTQQLFYGRPDVQYVSLHADPNRAYPYFTGYADETGAEGGTGTTLNLPLPERVDDDGYLKALELAVDAIDGFGPALLVVSLGVDTYRLDPIGDLQVTTEGFGAQAARIAALGRPTVIVQEGGYHVPDLGANVHAFLTALSSN